jgi:CDP-paratose synthetase
VNVLITGGNGFLGSALAEKFSKIDYNVSLVVRQESNLSRLQNQIENYDLFKFSNEIELRDILIKASPDIIIHTVCNYGRKKESILEIFDSNYSIGLLILNEIIAIEKKIVFLNIGTILPPETSLYSFSKNQFSDLGKFISKSFKNINFKNILLQHMYGPGDDESKFTSYIINSCIRNVEEVNLTSGEQLRDFIYIKDVAEAIAIVCKNISDIKVEDIEIGSGNLISVKEFALKSHELANSITKFNFGAIKYNNNQQNIPAANLLTLNTFNWVPSYSLEMGLVETIKIETK